ncbi:hypothetical protein HK099_002685, partial [Clydaea vesicula]
ANATKPLKKLWSEEDVWGKKIVEEKLEQELGKINFKEIESKLFQCISVNGINIKSKFFSYNQGPSLLIDRLDKSLSNCLGSLEAILGFSDLGILLGTSGCGKTRTIFEYLSKKYGFYFTITDDLYSEFMGSSDFTKFKKKIAAKDLNIHDKSSSQVYVDQFIHCLVAARFFVFKIFQKYLEDRFTPELWLFAQIFPRRYYADGDLFEKLVDILRHLDSKELKLFLEKYYVSQCTFFLDESQTLIDVNPKYFLSESNPLLGSSLLNAVKTSVFKISGLKFVPSGTGLRIGDVYGNEAVISGAAKQSGYRNVLIVSNIWENLENIEDYISTYLGDNNIDKKNCELLLGRPRPAARFVEYCLEKILVKEELNFNEEFSKFYKDLTSINDVKWSLSQLFDPKRLTYASEVLETLKMAVYFSYCFGFPYIISAAEGKMLFERSFGILVENEDLANALKDKMEKKEYFKNE